jgi:hypothetical protein
MAVSSTAVAFGTMAGRVQSKKSQAWRRPGTARPMAPPICCEVVASAECWWDLWRLARWSRTTRPPGLHSHGELPSTQFVEVGTQHLTATDGPRYRCASSAVSPNWSPFVDDGGASLADGVPERL